MSDEKGKKYKPAMYLGNYVGDPSFTSSNYLPDTLSGRSTLGKALVGGGVFSALASMGLGCRAVLHGDSGLNWALGITGGFSVSLFLLGCAEKDKSHDLQGKNAALRSALTTRVSQLFPYLNDSQIKAFVPDDHYPAFGMPGAISGPALGQIFGLTLAIPVGGGIAISLFATRNNPDPTGDPALMLGLLFIGMAIFYASAMMERKQQEHINVELNRKIIAMQGVEDAANGCARTKELVKEIKELAISSEGISQSQQPGRKEGENSKKDGIWTVDPRKVKVTPFGVTGQPIDKEGIGIALLDQINSISSLSLGDRALLCGVPSRAVPTLNKKEAEYANQARKDELGIVNTGDGLSSDQANGNDIANQFLQSMSIPVAPRASAPSEEDQILLQS